MNRNTEIQAALYTRLTGDVAIMALVTGVYDDVPQDTTYPYIVIGENTLREDDTQTYLGTDNELLIHCWSRYSGRLEVKNIMKAIYNALHRVPLALASGDNWELLFDSESSVMEPDGETRHGIQRFKLYTVR